MEEKTCVEVIQYTPFYLFISSSYWHKVADKKLNKDKTSEIVDSLWAYCTTQKGSPKLFLDYSSFNKESVTYLGQSLRGYQLNKNSKESFENECNSNSIVKKIGDELFEKMKSGNLAKDLQYLVPFIIYTFSDLKTFKFYYRVCYITYDDDYFFWCDFPKSLKSQQELELKNIHKTLSASQRPMYFIELNSDDRISVITIEDFILNYTDCDTANRYLCFSEPEVCTNKPSLIVRNGLYFMLIKCPKIFNTPLKIILLKGIQDDNVPVCCMLYTIQRISGPLPEVPTYTGWEKDEFGNQKVRLTDLSSSMDPLKLSEKLIYLNLQLMKWNIEPEFSMEMVAGNSCLLLGAGTLGCSVVRSLLGWGVKKITLVDCGIVSYTNPLRQSLYTFNDCIDRKVKVKAAVDAIKKINPHVEVTGENFMIPMLGHGQIDIDNYEKLECLIKDHDIIFLLTDSRESRWLPTLLCSFYSKITITVAIGFDSYLVMRHGIPYDDENHQEKLGCYFCTDVVAPGNSMGGRLLDQQCTVTRIGIAEIASALAVELTVSLMHHPEQGKAKSDSSSCFGKIPHTIRGFLKDFEQIFPSFKNYDKCVACSSFILNEFNKNKVEFLKKVFPNPKILEDITGITEMKVSTMDEHMIELSDSE